MSESFYSRFSLIYYYNSISTMGEYINRDVLSIPRLKELQRIDDTTRVSVSGSLWKYWNNDLFTDLEKEILRLKPSDCSFVEKYSHIESFPINNRSHINEISLATIYSDHPLREFYKRSIKDYKDSNTEQLRNAEKQLMEIDTLPVIIFIHGLGGQISQFEPILKEFRNCSDIFGIDLPGFGNSKRPSRNNNGIKFSMLSKYNDEELNKLEECLKLLKDEDYQTDSIADMIQQILDYKFPNRKFIFIAHSMGTHISTKIINNLENGRVVSFIMMSPPGFSEEKVIFNRFHWSKRWFLNLCCYNSKIFDYYRFFDRFGGLYSISVNNYIYCNNERNIEDEDDGDGGDEILKRLTQFRWNLDTESSIFLKYLKGFRSVSKEELKILSSKISKGKMMVCCGEFDKITKVSESEKIVKMIKEGNNDIEIKFEKVNNCNHSLFLDKPELISGIIYKFIEDLNINISCTWVLKIKAILSGDKWGLKNEVKWNKVVTLSKPIINKISPNKPISYLLGMKTLRQTDLIHNPINFEMEHPEIFAIVDIGSDTPSYEPNDFQRIKYIKYKTESKVTPDNITIVKFIEIINKLMKERDIDNQFIVVHCHYGQNRTGFLICCYLIEKLGWSVNEAIIGFKESKEPGIKHVHFQNALHLRYNE